MTDTPSEPAGLEHRARPLRMWPAWVLLFVLWAVRFGLPAVEPEAVPFGVLGGAAGGFLLSIWWLFFSRAPQRERWTAAGLVLLALVLTHFAVDKSLATGMQGFLIVLFPAPWVALAFVLAVQFGRGRPPAARRNALVALLVLALAPWTLLRTGGFTGSLEHDWNWRWAPTAEEQLLAREGAALPERAAEPATGDAESGEAEPAALWPGFRGDARDARVTGVRLDTDWESAPPEQLWRRGVGPGWSSFSVRGNRAFTQEQRGEEEVVSCYDLLTGEPLWGHADATRFWESNAGAGPRGTPTVSGSRVYALGATGILNVLDAETGALVWSRNVAEETGVPVPEWGFSGSPWVWQDLVLVPAAGTLVAYDRESGEQRWSGPTDEKGYSSPHLCELEGVEQVLLIGGAACRAFRPADGKVLWEYPWSGDPIVQPGFTEDGDLLLSVGALSGLRRVGLTRDGEAWSQEERWTTKRLKPYYNDFVVHDGHAYGFDGSRIACVDLADGARKWKGGRYGNGQLLLVADSDVLVVLSEEGELALVAASPEEFTELARIPGIESKTWNHPVLVDDVLLVRNAEEMAAFRLPLAGE